MIQVTLHDAANQQAWDAFVLAHPESSVYHLWAWRRLLGPALGHRAHSLSAWEDGRLVGVLPLIELRRPVLGNLLVSLPFVNYGGILASEPVAAAALERAALELAERLKVKGLELRHQDPQPLTLSARTHRVSLLLSLPESADALWNAFPSKLRSQIRKGDKNGLVVRSGGLEHLDAFYQVFAQNMLELGSPVWSKAFFRRVLETFPDRARIYRADFEGKPVAAGLVLRFKHTTEIPWASSLRAFNSLNSNLRLYWEMIGDAARLGYQWFDFGRSEPDGPTYKFKVQWGARPRPLHWYHHPATATGQGLLDRHRERIEASWRRLPPEVANVAGPVLRRLLPH